jgi:hypothetical protein
MIRDEQNFLKNMTEQQRKDEQLMRDREARKARDQSATNAALAQ